MSWSTARVNLDAKLLTASITGNIIWPNQSADVQTALHYRVALIPSGVQPELQGADHETGIYQVSVYAPLDTGTGPAITAAQTIIDHFKRANLSGTACGVPTLGPPIQEDTWWIVPVSIPFIQL